MNLRALAAIAALSIAAAGTARAADPVTIPVILPLTGPAAFAGTGEWQAIQVYEAAANKAGGIRGRPVHFEVQDDQSSPQVAVQLVTRLAEKKAAVFIGPATTGECASVEPIVRANGPVMYCLSPGLQPEKGSFVFAGARSIDATVAPMVKYVNDSRYMRVAILSATDASGQAGYRGLMHSLPLFKNVSLVDDQKFAPASITATAEVAHIKSAQPQAIFVFATGPAFAVALRALKDAGLDIPVLSSSANYNAALLAQYTDFLPRDLLFDGFPFQAGRPSNRVLGRSYDNFTQAFKNAGLAPTSLSAYAWDPTDIVVRALRALGPDASADQIRNYILALHDHAGLSGIYDFGRGDQHGLGNDSTVLVRWDAKNQTGSAVSHPGGHAVVSSTQTGTEPRDFTIDSALELALATVANTPDARRRQLFEALLRHLYAFLLEAKPTQQEWRSGLDFLKRTGQASTAVRDEFGLIDALLGTEMFVELLNSRRPPNATPNSVLGPFYHEHAPRLPYLADIRGGEPGEPVVIFGQVRSIDGTPLDGAEVDIWQTDIDGSYDVQKPEAKTNLRGRFRTDADGRYGCVAVIARHYDVPTDLTGGEMLRAMGRRASRPAHVHMRVRAAGYDEIITSIFPAGDPLIGSDAAFGVRSALIRPYEPATALDAERFGLALPFFTLHFDVTMAPP